MAVGAVEVAFVSYIYLEGIYPFCFKRIMSAFL